MKRTKKFLLLLGFIVFSFSCASLDKTDDAKKIESTNSSFNLSHKEESNSELPQSYSTNQESQNYKTQKTRQENVIIKERSDYRTYINGKYSGLTYRESEIYLKQIPSTTTDVFSGQAFVIQDTRRNMISTAKKVDEVLDVYFSKSTNGREVFSHDRGFPLFREFFDTLNLDYSNLAVGTKWEANARVVVFPLKEKGAAEFPIIVQYKYEGLSNYFDLPVFKVLANYGLRNNSNVQFSHIAGRREAEIFIDCKTKNVVFVREKVLEQFTYPDGTTVKNDGALLHFYTYANYVKKIITDKYKNIIAIETEIDKPAPKKIEFPKSNNYTVEETELGLKLKLQNLRFVADQDILLTGEEIKLDEIAEILKQFSGKKFFVEGHTASTGQPKNEKKLSEKRALVVVSELVKRGLPENLFLYSGAGATKPLADNSTREGMATNRRVEITILDK